MNFSKKQQGFTLVELIVGATIGAIVTVGALIFLVSTIRSYQFETGKLLINRDIRKFTTEMVDDATYANSFQIYDQYSNLARPASHVANGGLSTNPLLATYGGYSVDLVTTEPDDPVTTTGPGSEKVSSGLTGDVLVFVYNVDGDNTKIQKLLIYYRYISTPAGGTTGTNSTSLPTRTVALNRLVVNIDSTAQGYGIMRLLPVLTATTAQRTIFSYVDGQAKDSANSVNRRNKMFYNLNSTSVIVRGSIYENYTAQRQVKSTYNFTITPRG